MIQNTGDRFAAYLARRQAADKGFALGTVPEARELVHACDIVMTKSDGLNFEILCILDRESRPSRSFGLSGGDLQRIGKACLKHSGSVSGTKMPVIIHILEIGNFPADDEQKRRLSALKRPSVFSKTVPVGFALDTSSGAVWSTGPLGGWMHGRHYLQKLLRSPRREPGPAPVFGGASAGSVPSAGATSFSGRAEPAPPAALRTRAMPWLTLSLLAVMGVIFWMEVRSSGSWSPNVGTLLAMGADSKRLVMKHGEIWRMVTCAFLHADLTHILFNGVAMIFAGVVLEPLVGRPWYFAIFVFGALAGSALSLAAGDMRLISVGASGGIMALFAAALVSTARVRNKSDRLRLQFGLGRILVPALLPAAGSGGATIDVGAPIGGAMGGAAIALALLIFFWPKSEAVPQHGPRAAMAAAALVALSAVGLAMSQG
jgi:rhomboid protease GluP